MNEEDVISMEEIGSLDKIDENLEELTEDIFQDDTEDLMDSLYLKNSSVNSEVFKTAVGLLATPTVCSMLLDNNFLIFISRLLFFL